jgi:hypothetical protein
VEFLIQRINGAVVHDFSFQLIESCKYQNWVNQDNSFSYIFTECCYPEKVIPVGSVEFVQGYLKELFNITLKPRNIPIELMDRKFTSRNVFNGTEQDINKEYFVKSNDRIKNFIGIVDRAPVGNYQISETIDIDSEWRCFVYKNELVGLNNYIGDFTMFPNVSLINEMIKEYKSSPIAYTLDVGVNSNNTFIIEVHDFFSCGLYGFSDNRILPYMFSDWFNECVECNTGVMPESLGLDSMYMIEEIQNTSDQDSIIRQQVYRDIVRSVRHYYE